jgi:predicted GNAT family N-acyltransferase
MTSEPVIVEFDERHAPEIRRIRNIVFTGEQGIDQAIDFDGQDPGAVHVLVRTGQGYAGTGRMLSDGHIGRLAVLKEHRGRRLGTMAVGALVDEAKRRGMRRVYLGAQKQAVGFYAKLGFRECGEPYMEAGIEHVEMEKAV